MFLLIAACLLSGCSPLKVEKDLWKASNEKWEYRLSSQGPRFGEGWDVFLTVRAKTDSTVIFRRRILQNADTDIPEGFKRAALVDHGVLIVFVREGKDWGLLIDCSDGLPYLADYARGGRAQLLNE
jgi:hypothetical protein